MDVQEGVFVQDLTRKPDPCLTQNAPFLRVAVLTLLFLTMLGGIAFLVLLADRRYVIQIS